MVNNAVSAKGLLCINLKKIVVHGVDGAGHASLVGQCLESLYMLFVLPL